jgi:hypothetical protein
MKIDLTHAGPEALGDEAWNVLDHALEARTERPRMKAGIPYEIVWISRESSACASCARERIPSLR